MKPKPPLTVSIVSTAQHKTGGFADLNCQN